MADTKITALTAITTVDPAVDVLPIVDVSDTTMAASGTTKKITSNQILGAGGTATLASATITGDLTCNSNVNVGASPAFFGGKIATNGHIAISAGNYLKLWNSTGTGVAGINASAADTLNFALTNAFTTAMTLNATGLGVGVTPSAWVNFKAIQAQYACIASNRFGAGNMQTFIGSNVFYDGSNYKYIVTDTAARYAINDNSHVWYTAPSGTAGNAITFTQAMALDASGNLLVATTTNTPSARLYVNQASGSNPGIYIAGGASTTPLINFSGAGRFRSDGSYLVMETTNASGTIYVTANTNGVYLSPGGTSWTANSDERLKDIIEPISNAVSKVGSLRSVIGKFKTDSEGTRRTFLIAQDIQAVLPEAVDASNPDKLGVAYTDVIPLLVAAIKELTARVEALEA